MRALPVLGAWLTVAVAARTAHADLIALDDIMKRHAAKDVATLRSEIKNAPERPELRCALGVVYAHRNDLTRAMLYLAGCEDARLTETMAPVVAEARVSVKKRLKTAGLTEVNLYSSPGVLRAEIDRLPGEVLDVPSSVWLGRGSYKITTRTLDGQEPLEYPLEVQEFSKGNVFLDRKQPVAKPPATQVANFEEEQSLDPITKPPPDVKRRSMISNKLLGIPDEPAGPALEDPLAVQAPAGPRPWIGVRLGGGVFDDGAATASVRPSVALTGRFRLGDATFVAARVDWSRRGGASEDAIDALGASVGAGITLVDQRYAELAVLGQLRGDLRFADDRAMTSVSRAGLSVATGIEIAFPTTPLAAGLRFEQGVTELVPGTRDRALLVELGVDWR